MFWLILLLLLLLIGCLPLGVKGIYSEDGAGAWLIVGPVRIRLYPGKEKKKPKQETLKRKENASVQKPVRKESQEKNGGKLTDFLPLMKILPDFLGDLRRKLRVDRLELKLTMAGDDPCDLAINYGKAWASVGNLMPMLERFFVIKKRDVDVSCDFAAEQTLIYVRIELTLTVWRILVLVIRHGWRAIRTYLKINEKKKGGAVK